MRYETRLKVLFLNDEGWIAIVCEQAVQADII